jgi:HPt (histidine-containing phosphotransfer) domain-containing protein
MLLPLVPGYLLRRAEEVRRLGELLKAGDFDTIQSIGHKLSGNASTYGFHEISRIGVEIENAAQCKDSFKIKALIARFAEYLGQIEVTEGQ